MKGSTVEYAETQMGANGRNKGRNTGDLAAKDGKGKVEKAKGGKEGKARKAQGKPERRGGQAKEGKPSGNE